MRLSPGLIALLAGALAARPALADPPAPAASAPDEYRTLRFTGGLTLGGAGLLSLAMGSVYGVRTFIEKGAAGHHCDSKGRCDLTGYTAQTDAHDSATLSTISVAVGLTLATAGVILAVTAAPRRTPAGVSSGRVPRAAGWLAPGPRGFVAGLRW